MRDLVLTVAVAVLLLVASTLTEGAKSKRGKKSEKSSNLTVTSEAVFDFEIVDYHGKGDDFRGRVTIGLFGKAAPMTVFNFEQLCKGVKLKGKTLEYRGTMCHRLVKDMLLQCGDVTTGDGTGSESVYGGLFRDEGFKVGHNSGGIVSMANRGKDTNGSQFFFLFTKARYLDEFHVAFGKVVKGMDILEVMNEMGSKKSSSNPAKKIFINDCKVEDVAKPYTLSEEQLTKDDLEA